MSVQHNYRIPATAISPELLRQIEGLVSAGRETTLVGANGDNVLMPHALSEVLSFVVDAMKRNQSLIMMEEDAALTTQGAAQLLGMSRPYLLRLLDAGTLPFHRVGTHRRILLRDLQNFQVQRDADRRTRLDALTLAVDEAGVYDRF